MAKGVLAILCHYSSTQKDPQHQYCREGETFRSKFQMDECNGGHAYSPLKDPIPNIVTEVNSACI